MGSRSNSEKQRKSSSFLSKLRPPSLIISKRSQNYDVESHNYVNDPEEEMSTRSGSSFSLRRDSISLSSVISTLLRKPDKNVSKPEDRSGPHAGKKSERSKSFNIKCDSKTSPYFEIELMEDNRRRRQSLDGYNRRLSISEYAKMFPELLSESSESSASETQHKRLLTKTNSFSIMNGGGVSSNSYYSDYGTQWQQPGRNTNSNRKKVQRSVSSVSELIAPHIPKSDDIVSTRPEGGYEDTLSERPNSSAWLDEAMPSVLSERLTPKKSPLNSSCSTLSSASSSPLKTGELQSSSPGLSRTQELEDYAKQYEDLYSKRILSNRSSRLMVSSDEKPKSAYPNYSMSLPRKLPPVKTLVSAFNDQINQQRLKQESRRFKLREEEPGRTRCNVYGTLPKKSSPSSAFFNDENSSDQFHTNTTPLRKYSSRKSSSKRASVADPHYVILEKDETPGEGSLLHGEEEEGMKGRVSSPSSSSEEPNLLRSGGGSNNTVVNTSRSLEENGGAPFTLLCDMNASELESWRRRQEVERLRVLKLGENVTPPKLPPKNPHLRNKGTFLLETDFDEVPISHSNSFKKPPAPSPPSTPNSSSTDHWDPHSTSTPENGSEFATRAYHKDSFMAHRRDYNVEQQTESFHKDLDGDKYKSRNDPPLTKTAISDGGSTSLYPEAEKTTSECELSNLSLYSDWEKNNSVGQSTKSMRFTSDAVKGIRSSSSGKVTEKFSSPPPVAPKPYNRSLSERHPVKYNPALSSSSFNVSANPVLSSSSSSHIHSSKSTPSLNTSESAVLLARKLSQQPESKRQTHSSSGFEKWKRSMDSLDATTNAANPARASARFHLPPPPSEIRTSKSGTLGPSSNAPHLGLESLSESKSGHSRATSLDTAADSQISPPKHFHSNSDSGLSSLGGRTSTMSPVSTISSVSSGSSVSSRASLRSASIVSSSTLPGDAAGNLIEEEDADETTEESLRLSSPASRHSFHAGRKSSRAAASRNRFQEEIDCEKVFQRLTRALESLSPSEKPCIDALLTLFFTSSHQKTLLDYVDGILDLESNNELFHSLETSKMKKEDSSKFIKNSLGSHGSVVVSQTASPLNSEGPSSLPAFLHGSNSSHEYEAIKAELLQKVDRKLSVLRSAQLSLKEEVHLNEELGKNIAEEVKKRLSSPCEYDKFDLHIQEMDKIANLLLGLSGRLARVENNLLALSIDGNRSDEIYRVRSEEGKLLLAKKDKLADQLLEAKKLKQNIDRRSNLVAKILRKNVSDEFYLEYLQYIRNKTRLILDSREVYDKIKLGEEQVYALKTS